MADHLPQDPDALPPDLQAAVDAARNPVVPLHWVDAYPVEGLTTHASADPDWKDPEPEPVTDEELSAIEEQLQVLLWRRGCLLRRRVG